MNKRILVAALPVLLVVLLIVANMATYTVQETQLAIITQFGRPIGEPVTAAGLHFKTPLVQQVNYLEKRVMEWDSAPEQVPTKDKLFIIVDTYARWRISDPLLFFQTLRDEISAQSRLDDILDGEVRNSIARHPLIELVRTDKARKPIYDQALTSSGIMMSFDWPPIEFGRSAIANEINLTARKKLVSMGIELIDLRFKRINYNTDVELKIYERMVSERQQIAEKFRSEGQGEAARILGEKERDLRKIESEAYRQVQELRGKADAEATDIYAAAYNQSAEAYQFYQFEKTLETYLTTLDKGTTLILSTGSDYFKFLKDVNAGGPVTRGPAPTGAAGPAETLPGAAGLTPAR